MHFAFRVNAVSGLALYGILWSSFAPRTNAEALLSRSERRHLFSRLAVGDLRCGMPELVPRRSVQGGQKIIERSLGVTNPS